MVDPLGGGMAMRRRVMPLRARETLIIPITQASWGTIGAWEALLDSEARWLPWVLDKFGLPNLAQILPPV
jgi:hypothetical protein